jgi:hypothetical protein
MGFMSYRERTLLRLLERNPQGLNVFEIAAKLGIGRKLTAIRLEDLEVGELGFTAAWFAQRLFVLIGVGLTLHLYLR